MTSHTLTAAGIDFMANWQARFPETPPIGHHFKHFLAKRWMRIYSLPDAQRYARDKAEWDILLARQNAVIDHLIPQDTPIQFVFTVIKPDSHIFVSFDLTPLGHVYHADDAAAYELWALNDIWHSGHYDVFLSMIADEDLRAFIIAPDCLIAPYDGGVDVILRDPHSAHAFKRHFSDWVSPRADGL